MCSVQEPVVGVLAEQWRAIVELGGQLDDAEWALPSECPGWTVKDLVSHMVGTERSLLGERAPDDGGPRAAHVHNDMGATNERWVAERRRRPAGAVLEEFAEVTARRLSVLEAMTPEQFAAPTPSPVGEVPYRTFMEVRVMDCWVHEQDMRVATGRPGHARGSAARLAMERIASAMPVVVARRAGAPDGAAVRFEMVDDPDGTVEVVVRQGRGALSDAPADRPTVVLRMEHEVFWRLGCGRVHGDAALAAGLVVVEGDVGLGERVVRHMAFMI